MTRQEAEELMSTYYMDIGHEAAVTDLIALVPDKALKLAALTLKLQNLCYEHEVTDQLFNKIQQLIVEACQDE